MSSSAQPSGRAAPGAGRKRKQASASSARPSRASIASSLSLARADAAHRRRHRRPAARSASRRPSRRIAAAWTDRRRAARARGPSGRAGRYRCGSAARRSWCSRAAPAITPKAFDSTAISKRAIVEDLQRPPDRRAAASDSARRCRPGGICTTSAEPSPGESCTTQSRSRCGLSPRSRCRSRPRCV